MRYLIASLFLSLTILPASQAAAESGLPIPRFVSIKSDEANMRVGPEQRFPIKWVYHKQGLPVEIIEEHQNWRKVRDIDGEEGWLFQSLLSGNRTAIVQGTEAQLLRLNPDDNAPAILKVEPGVMGNVITCQPHWCRMLIVGRKGWIRKPQIWGIYSREVF